MMEISTVLWFFVYNLDVVTIRLFRAFPIALADIYRKRRVSFGGRKITHVIKSNIARFGRKVNVLVISATRISDLTGRGASMTKECASADKRALVASKPLHIYACLVQWWHTSPVL